MSAGIRFVDATARRGGFSLHIGDAHLLPGKVTVFLGANGCGKTTVLRLAAGLDRPAQGRVMLGHADCCSMSASARAAAVAYVPQRPAVGAPFTAQQVVELGRHALPRDPTAVQEALRAVGLLHRATDPYHALSAGQQQRVAIARALAQHRVGGLLILDEALSAVDPPETHQMAQLIRDLAQRGSVVAMATHDLSVAAAVAHEVWFLAEGRVAALGSAEQILAPQTLGHLTGVPIAVAHGSRGSLPIPDWTAILGRRA